MFFNDMFLIGMHVKIPDSETFDLKNNTTSTIKWAYVKLLFILLRNLKYQDVMVLKNVISS